MSPTPPHARAVLGDTAAILFLSLFFAVALLQKEPPVNRSPLSDYPRFTLWAWERPEDLRALDAGRFAVAYLAGTITITDAVSVSLRKQPLLVSPGTRTIAVVRIEAPAGIAQLSAPTLPSEIAGIVADALRPGNASAIQVDFDARQSQREFYRSVLIDLRRRLPPNTPISMTALASWCAYDDWIHDLPVNEAVPMYFRMGPDHFASDMPGWLYPNREPLCRGIAGVSTDEAWPKLPAGERLYIFHSRAWNPIALQNLEHLLPRDE